MTKQSHKKGSLWSKWDFHVHTPASHLATTFGEDWDVYVKNLVQAASQENISAIGVTDYFSSRAEARSERVSSFRYPQAVPIEPPAGPVSTSVNRL